MGHRALIAYERPDRTYNIHYSHWGALNLQLTDQLTPSTPFGSDQPDQRQQATYEQLLTATTVDREGFDEPVDTDPAVRPEPEAVGVGFDALLEAHLNYLAHEALYVVDIDFQITAYRTHWFGLQYDCETITDGPRVGNGAVRTVRWCDGEPVGDGATLGEFQALKGVVGDMVDHGVFDHEGAVDYLIQKLRAWTGDAQTLHVRRPE